MGRTAAQMFATEGAKVVVAEFGAAGQEDRAAGRGGRRSATFVKTDVSKEADAKGMIAHAVATYGRVDVLYNNAGVMPEASLGHRHLVEAWDHHGGQRAGHLPGLQVRHPRCSNGAPSVISISASWLSWAAPTRRTPTPRPRAPCSR